MAQEELILNTLLRLENKIGGIDAKIDTQVKATEKQDDRLNAHAKRIGAIETYHTAQKTRTGMIAAISGGAVSLGAWVAKILIATHTKT